MSWLDSVIKGLDPAPEPPAPEIIEALRPLMNSIRKAKGEPELSQAEHLASWVPPDPDRLAAALDAARRQSEVDEAALRLGPSDSTSEGGHFRGSDQHVLGAVSLPLT